MRFRKISLSVGAAALIGGGVALGVTHVATAGVSQPSSTPRIGTPGFRFAGEVPKVSMAPAKVLSETANYSLTKTNFYNTPTSGNWSGYVTPASAGAYTETQTTFTVPAVSCAKDPNAAVSFWPGIDGAGNNSVEQLGITDYCDGTTPGYFPWVEEYPDPSMAIGPSANTVYVVKPGDVITAGVSDASAGSGADYNYTMTDAKEGWSYTQTLAMPDGITGEDLTSEVIAETPTNGETNYLFPLANFGSVAFSNSDYNTSTPFSSANSTGYNIADDGELLDSIGTATNGAFSVAYKNSDESVTPAGLNASADNISVGWTAVSGATKYEVKIDGPSLDRDGTVSADQTHAIYYNIAAGTYKYQVRAINAAGDSAWSAVKSVVFSNGANSTEENSTAAVSDAAASATGAPATPTGLNASADNISVGWTAVPGAERYEVTIVGPNLDRTGSVSADQTHAIYYNIAKGTFKYEVRTLNATGYSPWSAVKSVVFAR